MNALNELFSKRSDVIILQLCPVVLLLRELRRYSSWMGASAAGLKRDRRGWQDVQAVRVASNERFFASS